jgi:hypothetical protein
VDYRVWRSREQRTDQKLRCDGQQQSEQQRRGNVDDLVDLPAFIEVARESTLENPRDGNDFSGNGDHAKGQKMNGTAVEPDQECGSSQKSRLHDKESHYALHLARRHHPECGEQNQPCG